LIQRSEAVRNRTEGLSLSAAALVNIPTLNGEPIHIEPVSSLTGASSSRLYVGSLHFSLTEEDVKAVFEPFGAIVGVDLHREPGTLKSKGFAFIQFVDPSSAEKAIQHMNGFDLAGRQIKVGHVASKGAGVPMGSSMGGGGGLFAAPGYDASGAGATMTSSFDEGGGGESAYRKI
jgi:RNA-binding protein 39